MARLSRCPGVCWTRGAAPPLFANRCDSVKLHPRHVLLGAQASAFALPVCDHYSGVEARMRKSLWLQAEMAAEFGACVFDVTLDCEDGAPVGGEAELPLGAAHVGS